jgi:PhzF family phenazine biosynthesis protein
MLLDVFTNEVLLGNPLAVVIDADGLNTSQMQRFANWMNLSETTFLLPPSDSTADYQVRIFTPTEELPFAGHPTLGSAYAWLTHGGQPRQPEQIVQECGVGLVKVRRDNQVLAFAAPPLLRSGPVDEPIVVQATESLGIARSSVVDAAWVDNGPGWLGLLLSSAAEVRAVQPRSMGLPIGIIGPCSEESPFAFEVRAFYSANGVTFEDPVTGSLNASLAQWLIGSGRATAPYLATQGSVLGRAGVVRINTDESGTIWVGGDVVSCISGTVDI